MTGVPAQRVLFHGVTGSGKTSAAHAYAIATGVPEFSADDDLGWLPGWKGRPLEDQYRIEATIAAQDQWVLVSAYSSWRDTILARTELIVFLDYPRWLSLGGLIRRTIRRIISKHPVCNGNTETLRRALAKDSIIAWHFKTFTRKRDAIKHIRADPSMPPVLSFHRPRDLNVWIAAVAPVQPSVRPTCKD
ncbi:adenylate kinase [Arthrobacter agilis]|uniref:adenylate kinase n=1 Tax=Arthrobacter agilis TaxID=37921 RepID=UPI000B353EF3|nr:adenylate kinase [Arthrobacter agilis]OUM45686.1 adenylate kinase [Arthrobacter agilis]PPB47791.1 adenylate kinase [Arthrobacter agilis]TPV21421.1 adenylate kinase [Arthrobacter agilis]